MNVEAKLAELERHLDELRDEQSKADHPFRHQLRQAKNVDGFEQTKKGYLEENTQRRKREQGLYDEIFQVEMDPNS